MDKLVTSKHPVFKCSNMLQTGALMKRKKRGGVETHFEKRVGQSSHAHEYDVGAQSTLFTFTTNNWIQNKISVRIQASTLDLNREEVTALAHHRPQDCAVGEHLPRHEQSIRAVGDPALLQSAGLYRR